MRVTKADRKDRTAQVSGVEHYSYWVREGTTEYECVDVLRHDIFQYSYVTGRTRPAKHTTQEVKPEPAYAHT